MPTQLSVNINKIATLRNTRSGTEPSPQRFATIALDAGAYGVTVHPRPDERHIRPADVADVVELLKARRAAGQSAAEFNIEGNPFEGQWLSLVEKARPDQATLVPDSVDQMTSDHGFTPSPPSLATLKPMVAKLKSWGCRVSLFMDPDPEAIKGIAETGCDRIELYTGTYAAAFLQGGDALKRSLNDFARA
ncbi:MAG: pyridoxine 5'-phosphate synthase, partial [Myxococcota bacterium]